MKKALVLRTNDKDNRSYGGFQWGEVGDIITAPDWEPTKECGKGLHGALWGQGDGDLFNWGSDAIWMLVEVDQDKIIDLDGKVKFPSCKIVAKGERKEVTDILVNKGYQGVIGCTITGGDLATVTGGDESTVTGGDRSTVTGGDGATVTGGNKAIVTGGDRSTVTGGDRSIVTGGYGATVTGGYESTVTGGYGATVTGGYESTVTGGYWAILQLKYFDGNRTRIATAYVGEDGIKPNTPYKLDKNNKFVKA